MYSESPPTVNPGENDSNKSPSASDSNGDSETENHSEVQCESYKDEWTISIGERAKNLLGAKMNNANQKVPQRTFANTLMKPRQVQIAERKKAEKIKVFANKVATEIPEGFETKLTDLSLEQKHASASDSIAEPSTPYPPGNQQLNEEQQSGGNVHSDSADIVRSNMTNGDALGTNENGSSAPSEVACSPDFELQNKLEVTPLADSRVQQDLEYAKEPVYIPISVEMQRIADMYISDSEDSSVCGDIDEQNIGEVEKMDECESVDAGKDPESVVLNVVIKEEPIEDNEKDGEDDDKDDEKNVEKRFEKDVGKDDEKVSEESSEDDESDESDEDDEDDEKGCTKKDLWNTERLTRAEIPRRQDISETTYCHICGMRSPSPEHFPIHDIVREKTAFDRNLEALFEAARPVDPTPRFAELKRRSEDLEKKMTEARKMYEKKSGKPFPKCEEQFLTPPRWLTLDVYKVLEGLEKESEKVNNESEDKNIFSTFSSDDKDGNSDGDLWGIAGYNSSPNSFKHPRFSFSQAGPPRFYEDDLLSCSTSGSSSHQNESSFKQPKTPELAKPTKSLTLAEYYQRRQQTKNGQDKTSESSSSSSTQNMEH